MKVKSIKNVLKRKYGGRARALVFRVSIDKIRVTVIRLKLLPNMEKARSSTIGRIFCNGSRTSAPLLSFTVWKKSRINAIRLMKL